MMSSSVLLVLCGACGHRPISLRAQMEATGQQESTSAAVGLLPNDLLDSMVVQHAQGIY